MYSVFIARKMCPKNTTCINGKCSKWILTKKEQEEMKCNISQLKNAVLSIPKHAVEKHHRPGLVNCGNTCYFNAFFQIYSCFSSLRTAIYQFPDEC